ncbi:MAG: hypothetical protein Q7T05_03310 [Dehalococcoidia bacterium]|nr:hypothetical protein [Dehalococcoidia bacterium]
MKYEVNAELLFTDRAARDKVAKAAFDAWLLTSEEAGDSFACDSTPPGKEPLTTFDLRVRGRATLRGRRERLAKTLKDAKLDATAKRGRVETHVCGHDQGAPCVDMLIEDWGQPDANR